MEIKNAATALTQDVRGSLDKDDCTHRGEGGLKRNLLSGQRGFTLIELMVVIVILAILTAVIAPRIIGRTDDAKVTETKVQIRNLETALKMYKLDNGRYPTTAQGLSALLVKPTTGTAPKNWKKGGYMESKKVPLDPWKNNFVYLSPGLYGDYDLLSYGADGAKGGVDYDADIKSWEID